MRKAAWSILLAICAVSLAAGAEQGDAWLTDFETAKKMAAEKKLPILADFSGSDWCGWCIRLDKEVFSQKEFQDYANQSLVLFLADFPRKKAQDAKLKAQNAALMKTYKVEGFPTVLLLDAGGKVIATTGYEPGGAKAYVEHIKKILAASEKK